MSVICRLWDLWLFLNVLSKLVALQGCAGFILVPLACQTWVAGISCTNSFVFHWKGVSWYVESSFRVHISRTSFVLHVVLVPNCPFFGRAIFSSCWNSSFSSLHLLVCCSVRGGYILILPYRSPWLVVYECGSCNKGKSSRNREKPLTPQPLSLELVRCIFNSSAPAPPLPAPAADVKISNIQKIQNPRCHRAVCGVQKTHAPADTENNSHSHTISLAHVIRHSPPPL